MILARDPRGRRGPRALIVVGAALTAAGLAIAATAPLWGAAPLDRIQGQQTAGGIFLLAGWATLAWGIHRFGRG